MAVNVLRQITRYRSAFPTNRILSARPYSLHEPDYLKAMEPEFPLYPRMCVKISGYVYPLLESYQSLIHKIAGVMDMDIDDGYAFPLKKIEIQRFKPHSTVVSTKYELNIYRRHVIISDIPSVKMPIFIRILEATIPEGVTLVIEPYDAEKAGRRYIPDTELMELKDQLEVVGKK